MSNSLTCGQMASGTMGENSRWALGFHGKSGIAAKAFLMTGLRDIHFEQRSVTFPPRLLGPQMCLRFLTLPTVCSVAPPFSLPPHGPLLPSDRETNQSFSSSLKTALGEGDECGFLPVCVLGWG